MQEQEEVKEEQNLEAKMKDLFSGSVSATGEEELLRIASRYSRQYSSGQAVAYLFIHYLSIKYKTRFPVLSKYFITFLDKYEELKQYVGSDRFVMEALSHISLRKYLTENSFKVNIEK